MSVKLWRPLLSRRSLIATVAGLPLAASAGNRAAAQDDDVPDASSVLQRTAPQPAPPLSFTDLKGKAMSLGHFAGHPLVVNIWATWCGFCLAELPSLNALAPRIAPFGGKVLAISIDDDGATSVPAYLATHKLQHLQVMLDVSGDVLDVLNVSGIPVTLVLDAQGQLVARLDGAADWDTDGVVALVKSLVAAPTDAGVTQV